MTSNYEQVLSRARALPAPARLRLISALADQLAMSGTPAQENGAELHSGFGLQYISQAR